MTGMKDLLQRLEQAAQSFLPAGNGSRENDTGTDRLAQALCDVARHYGEHTTSVALKAGLPLADGLLPLEYVVGAARRAGLQARPQESGPAQLSDLDLPAIVVLADGGADVVWAIDRDAAGRPAAFLCSEAGNPALRASVPAHELIAASARLVRLVPLPAGEDRAGEAAPSESRGWFLAAFADSRRIYAEAIAATVAINVLALAMPLFTMNVYDRVLPNAAAETLWSLAIGVVLATLFDLVIKVLRGRFVDAAGRRADVLLGNLVFARLIGARMASAGVSAGVRANTLRELDTLREFYNSATLTAFGDLPFLALFLGMIGVVSGSLVLVPLASIPIILAIAWMTQRSVGRLMAASMRQSAVKNAVVVETVAGLESIKAAGAESWAASLWERATAESIRTGNEIKHYSNIGVLAIYGVQTLTQVVMIVVGFYMAATGALSSGGLIAATMLAGRAMQPLSQIAMLITRLHQTRQSWQLLDEIVRAPQERPEGTAFVMRSAIRGDVAFEAVTFRYEKDGPPVLGDVSFTIAPGEHVGLIGGIGGGKSTALRLVHGLLHPTDGRVLIDGIPVSQLDPAVMRAHIGLALQQADLFHGTIRSNIMLGDPVADEEALIEAARVSCALDWIVRLPKGLETPVRERGAGLSGGQRQTIVLARALLRRPSVLLLDEPTSDLDPRTEQAVVDRLKPWLRGRTAIIVTHRPAMLALVDRLIVLDAGRKRLDGPKASVLASLAAASGLGMAKEEVRR